jgi:23S rRNA (adenine2030-N6)-methyltransferase
MKQALKGVPELRWISAELKVSAASSNGMYGSGVFVVNPPWPLHAQLQQCLPVLVSTLGDDNEAGFELDAHGI